MVGIAKRVASVVACLVCLGVLSSQRDVRPWLAAAAQDECSAKPIVCENDRDGNPDFDVNPAGDASIEGFADDISVNKGQSIGFKVNTTAARYEIQIYRLGYYRGAGARKIATLGPFAPTEAQPECLTQPGTGLVDCANWRVTATWTTTPTTVSGIYVA